MGFFGNFGALTAKSIALIDIGSGSVAGGYLSNGKEGPTLEYTVRVPIALRTDEPLAFAMLRALAEVDHRLTVEGASELRRRTGSGSVTEVLVSVASPWQDTSVRTEHVEEAKPFTFTRSLMKSLLQKATQPKPDRIDSGESVIVTLLNGYQTTQPFGKEAKRADVVILSSSIEKTVAESIETELRRNYHTRTISFVAFAPLAYAVFRDAYPREKDYLIIDAAGESTDIAFVKHDFLEAVLTVPSGVNTLLRTFGKATSPTPDMAEAKDGVHLTRTADDSKTIRARTKWISDILETLKVFSEQHALPRTIFLLADDPVRDYVRRTLDDVALRSLWLSDEPLSVLPVLPSQFASYIKTGPSATGDAFLMMLALYHGKHIDTLGS